MIILSVLYELWTGAARLHSVGRYACRAAPRGYWTAIAL